MTMSPQAGDHARREAGLTGPKGRKGGGWGWGVGVGVGMGWGRVGRREGGIGAEGNRMSRRDMGVEVEGGVCEKE